MIFTLLLGLAAAGASAAQNQSTITWFSTTIIGEETTETSTILYGTKAITPVPTTTPPIVLVSSVITAPTASRNFNYTTWSTATTTLPLTTSFITLWQVPASRPTITLPGTGTTTITVSPTLATVTIPKTICENNTSPLQIKTITSYTGSYIPAFSGQPTALPTIFPTAVTTFFRATYTYLVQPYTGTATTITSTASTTVYLSTYVPSDTTITINPAAGARGYSTHTSYSTSIISTSSVFQLDTTTVTRTAAQQCRETATVTFHTKCAPVNVVAERDGQGIGVRGYLPGWTYTFPYIRGLGDASACCHLCVGENRGQCVGSEWRWDTWDGEGICVLYYRNANGKWNDDGDGGLGAGALEYFGDLTVLPRQGSFVQSGDGCNGECGLSYMGLYNPYCPNCKL
ncbi:hypothetical protein V8F06_012812 [Rhypophila decipiens]